MMFQFLKRKLNVFNGDDPEKWMSFVGRFKSTCVSRGWIKYGEEFLIDLLVGLFEGKARREWDNWVSEETCISFNFDLVKDGFNRRLDYQNTPWKRAVQFHQIRMEDTEDIGTYIKRYMELSRKVSMEEKETARFFFSLPVKIRELLSRQAGGDWPLNIQAMTRFTQEVITVSESVGSFRKTYYNSNDTSQIQNTSVRTCFGCGERGHIKWHCPNRSSGKNNDSTKQEYITTIKSTNSSYVPLYVFVVLKFNQCLEKVRAMIDSGASTNFISSSLVEKLNVFKRKIMGRTLQLAVGRQITKLRHETDKIIMSIGNHEEEISFFVLKEMNEDLILGKSWLEKHNPVIDWMKGEMELSRCNCKGINSKQGCSDDNCANEGQTEECLFRINDVETDESSEFLNEFLGESKVSECNIPEEYKDFVHVFSEESAKVLPELHSKYQCDIVFKENAKLPVPRKAFQMSLPEKRAIEEFIEKGLKTGILEKAQSPIAMGMFLVKKANGDYREVVDFRPVNEITVERRNPIPCIDELMSNISNAKIFSKIDLRGAYNLLRIRPGDEWKTAFVCHLGQFQYKVMPFGLKTAPAIFQSMMEDIFGDLLRHSVVVYLDDILIYSSTKEEHIALVREVLSRLSRNRLLAKPEKCVFHEKSVSFLGYTISDLGVSIAKDKVETILQWPIPRSRKELKSFLGTASFSRKFIENFSAIVAPLQQLDNKTIRSLEGHWSTSCDEAFERLKTAMVNTPVLRHVDFNLPFIVETDASDFALGAVLLQPEHLNSDLYRPVSYASRKLSSAERNYSVYDKELLGIIFAFGKWHSYLYGAQHTIQVYTDHSNLQYFRTRQLLSGRHLRWKAFLQNFDFKLTYRCGSANVVADALSRRVDLAEEVYDTGNEDSSKVAVREEDGILLPNSIWNEQEDVLKLQSIELGAEQVNDKDERINIIKTRHDSLVGGHFGRNRTLKAIRKDFIWPKMRQEIFNYVDSCEVCQKAKSSRKRKFGLLAPLPIPERPWASISLDFIVGLPLSQGFNAILVVVDRYSKMVHLMQCNDTVNAKQTADLVLKNVVKLHGLPDDVVSDRGPQFVSKFWENICKVLGINRRMSTAAHPQTDGQTERMNQTLEQYLRCFVNHRQDNWSEILHFAEMAMNRAENNSTKFSPFEVSCGYSPRFDFLNEIDQSINCPNAENFIRQLKENWKLVTSNLSDSQKIMKKDADKLRSGHSFKIGDFVYLDTDHLQRKRPSKKLDFKRVGPFEIIERINDNAYRLKLPVGSRLHDVINVSKLYPFKGNVSNIQPDSEEINGYEEYEVERILDSKMVNGVQYFLIKWKGYSDLENTWQTEEDMGNCAELLEEFNHSKIE